MEMGRLPEVMKKKEWEVDVRQKPSGKPKRAESIADGGQSRKGKRLKKRESVTST